MAEKNEYINEAYQIIKHISEDERKRYEYESREKAIRDHNHILYMAKKEVKEAKEKAEADIKKARKEAEADIKKAREEAEADINRAKAEREKALAKGLKDGMETGLEVFIQYNLEQGILQEQIIENLQKRFNLNSDLANIYYEKYK